MVTVLSHDNLAGFIEADEAGMKKANDALDVLQAQGQVLLHVPIHKNQALWLPVPAEQAKNLAFLMQLGLLMQHPAPAAPLRPNKAGKTDIKEGLGYLLLINMHLRSLEQSELSFIAPVALVTRGMFVGGSIQKQWSLHQYRQAAEAIFPNDSKVMLHIEGLQQANQSKWPLRLFGMIGPSVGTYGFVMAIAKGAATVNPFAMMAGAAFTATGAMTKSLSLGKTIKKQQARLERIDAAKDNIKQLDSTGQAITLELCEYLKGVTEGNIATATLEKHLSATSGGISVAYMGGYAALSILVAASLTNPIGWAALVGCGLLYGITSHFGRKLITKQAQQENQAKGVEMKPIGQEKDPVTLTDKLIAGIKAGHVSDSVCEQLLGVTGMEFVKLYDNGFVQTIHDMHQYRSGQHKLVAQQPVTPPTQLELLKASSVLSQLAVNVCQYCADMQPAAEYAQSLHQGLSQALQEYEKLSQQFGVEQVEAWLAKDENRPEGITTLFETVDSLASLTAKMPELPNAPQPDAAHTEAAPQMRRP